MMVSWSAQVLGSHHPGGVPDGAPGSALAVVIIQEHEQADEGSLSLPAPSISFFLPFK